MFILGKSQTFCVKRKQKHLPEMTMGKLSYSFLFSPPFLATYSSSFLPLRQCKMQGWGFISFEKTDGKTGYLYKKGFLGIIIIIISVAGGVNDPFHSVTKYK